MAVLRAYQPKEWVKFGDCVCEKDCVCSAFLIHRLGPAELRELSKKHSFKRKERWPDGWKEVSEVKDSFNDEYRDVTILGWKNVYGADGKELPFTPENLAFIQETTGLQFQDFLNGVLKTTQEAHVEIEKAEVKNSKPG